ncbi:MAG: efflux RND transporter permease subunit [Pseudobdellovibrionaceae bacterium]
MTHFFIDRPIFSAVLSIIMVIVGGIAYYLLPVAQYPEVVPPTVVVSAAYPGANAETVAQTVATPIEQEVNGVEDMLYMSSYSDASGSMSLTVTFKIGTDLDLAQVLVQNRVNTALPRLPEDVRRLGVNVNKSSPDMMMVIHLISPDNSLDELYLSNYALLRVKDELSRVEAVGSVRLFGLREYAIRIWLDPDKLSALGMTADEAINAVRAQNIQVSAGGLGEPPVNSNSAFQYTLSTQGRFDKPAQFEEVVVKTGDDGRLVRLKDVARVELGARDYNTNSYLGGRPALGIGVFQRPGTNALQGAKDLKAMMDELSKTFPKGMEYRIIYNPTDFVAQAIDAVYHTIFEAIILVVLVIIVFLQSFRAAIIPILAIPVSLIGTFAVMYGFGFSLNMLTLFGLVLAIGIVVDDAIVVVENVERHIREGKTPREAAHQTMTEVSTALIATSLVLVSVFIPAAFVPGMSGQFYKQFAITIAVATIISTFNSLSLSPAMAALFMKHYHGEMDEKKGFFLSRMARAGANRFNHAFGWTEDKYSGLIGGIVRKSIIVLFVYGGLIFATVFMAKTVPTGFIPMQDQGYAITIVSLPEGASLQRTDEVVQKIAAIAKDIPGVLDTVGIAGFSGATFTSSSNGGAVFLPFKSFEDRAGKDGEDMMSIIGTMQQRVMGIQDAFIMVVPPPPVRGIGNAGGFKVMLQDRAGLGLDRLLEASNAFIGQANQTPGLSSVYTTLSNSTPQIYLDIDRTKAQMLGVPLSNVFNTLQIYLGSAYVNDFNAYGRVYQVRAQADLSYRLKPEDILNLKTENNKGEQIPLGSFITFKNITGPSLIQRYNLYPAIPVSGDTAPGTSSGQALNHVEDLAEKVLPLGMGYQWTELAYQQKEAGNAAVYIFLLSVIFVFLVLAAQYESWTLPLAIILIVPMSALCALLGVWWRDLDNNILTQVGLITLIGLAAKNAILIVEFAKQNEEEGQGLLPSIIESCRTRLRPILMTSFAFILGVVPLMLATGAGAEMRQAMGTAVFFGMLGVTFFGLFLTPVFYFVIRTVKTKVTKSGEVCYHPENHDDNAHEQNATSDSSDKFH